MIATNSSDVAQHYAEMRIQTASVRSSVYLLHEKCGHLLGRARVYRQKRREYINRAQNILAQLQASLILDGDEVSESLYYLYDYCWTLLESGEDQDLVDAREVFSPLTAAYHVLLKTP